MTCEKIFELSRAISIPLMERIIVKSSDPEALKSYNFVWNINIF